MKQKKCYRIVSDNFGCYEVQERRKILWFSLWIEPSHVYLFCNTFLTIAGAKLWIEEGCPRLKIPKREMVYISDNCKDETKD